MQQNISCNTRLLVILKRSNKKKGQLVYKKYIHTGPGFDTHTGALSYPTTMHVVLSYTHTHVHLLSQHTLTHTRHLCAVVVAHIKAPPHVVVVFVVFATRIKSTRAVSTLVSP